MKLFALAVATVCLSLTMAVRSDAQLVTFSDRTTFLAAAGGGLSLADFEGLGGNTYQVLDSSVEASIPSGVAFSSNGGGPFDLFVAPAGFNGHGGIDSDSLFANFFGTPLIADFLPFVTAIGADVTTFDFGNSAGTISIDVREAGGGISNYSLSTPASSSGFFGVIASGGLTIDRIVFTPQGGFTAGIDDFLFGQANPTEVPEPSTMALLGGMCIPGFVVLRRKLRK